MTVAGIFVWALMLVAWALLGFDLGIGMNATILSHISVGFVLLATVLLIFMLYVEGREEGP